MSLLSFFQFIILFLICRVSVPHLILPPSHLPLLLDFIKERGCLSCSVPHSLYFADCIFMYNLVCSTHAYLSSNKLIYLLKKILIRCGVLATFKLQFVERGRPTSSGMDFHQSWFPDDISHSLNCLDICVIFGLNKSMEKYFKST